MQMNTLTSGKNGSQDRKRRSTLARVTAFSLSTVASIYSLSGTRALGTTNNPITATGWNHDLILDTSSSSSASIGFDIPNNYDFYVNGLVSNGVNSTSYGVGVPANGSIVSAATGDSSTFQMQSYTADNGLLLSTTTTFADQVYKTGTLALATPSQFSSMAFLESATNGAQTINYSINYTDGTTTTGSFSSLDWYTGGTTDALKGIGRASRSSNPVGIDTGTGLTNPSMYEYDPTVTAGKLVSSVTFTNTAAPGNGAVAIYAISGNSTGGTVAPTLTYTGAASLAAMSATGAFDTVTANFQSGGMAANFSNGSPVLFDDTAGSAPTTIAVASGIDPYGVIFNNSALSYTLTGSGIGGAGGLSLTNNGTVTLTNSNTYIGSTSVSGGGNLIIASGGAIASSVVTVATGSTLTVQSGGAVSTTPFALTDNGTVAFNNSSTTLSSLSGSGVVNLAGTTLNILNQQYGAVFNGSFGGSGTLILGGLVTLNSPGTFSGTTIFNSSSALITLGSGTALGISTSTFNFSGGTLAASTALTSGAGSALAYNYSFGAGSTAIFGGNFPIELTGNALNYNTSGVTFNVASVTSDPVTISGQIGVGGGPLLKTGAGTLILNNTSATLPNLITGAMNISAGTVQLNGAVETNTIATYNVGSASTSVASLLINDNSGFAGRIGGVISGTQINAKIYGLGNTITAPDPVTMVATQEYGALRGPDSGSATWAGLTTLQSASVISGGASGTLTVTGVISGAFQLQVSANNLSTTVLSAVNTYSGLTAINGSGGKLVLGINNAIASSASLNLDASATGTLGTIFDLAGYNTSVGFISTTAASAPTDVITNSGTSISTLQLNGTGGSFAGTIKDGMGGVAIYFNGTGTQTFGQADTYSGGTTLNNSGSLLGGFNSSFGSGTITMNNGYLGSNVSTGITISNPIVTGQTNGLGLNIANPITIAQGFNLPTGTFTPFRTTGTDPTAAHGVVSGQIIGMGGVNITGTLVFSGLGNTYSGGTNLSSGSLGITNDGAVGTGPVNFLGGALTFVGYTSNLSFNNSGAFATTLGAANNGTGSILDGIISGSAGLKYVGPGTLALAGANNYSGPTNISGGILDITGATLPITPVNLIGGTIQFAPGDMTDLTSNGRTLTFNASGGKVDTNGNNITFAGSISNIGSGTFTKLGSGTLTLSSPLNVTTLLMQTGTTAMPSAIALNGSSAVVTATNGVQIGEASGDVGMLSLDNGAKVINAADINIADQVTAGLAATPDVGILNVADTMGLGTSVVAADLYVGKGTGGTNVTGTVNETGGTVRINSSTGNLYVGQNGVGVYNLSGSGTVVAAAVTIAKTNTSTGTFNLNGGNLIATQIIPGVTTGSTGISTFNFNGGLLTANASSGTFMQGLTSATIGAGPARINTNGFTIGIGQNLASAVMSPGVDAGLIKTGAGTLTLTGASSYTGGTNLSSGRLNAYSTGALGSGAATLNTGTTLSLGSSPSVFVLNGGAALSGNTFQMTTQAGSEARSVWSPQPVSVTNANGFTASFVYQTNQATPGSTADGVTFDLQNDPRGTAALGASGGSLGYNGAAGAAISPSGSIQINLYQTSNGSPNTGTVFETNGALPPAFGNNSVLPVNLSSGHMILFTLAYNGSANTLQENLLDETTSQTFSITYPNVNFQTILGGTSAYIGFTGATGGINSIQNVSNLAFNNGTTATYINAIMLPANATATVEDSAFLTNNTIQAGPLTIGSGAQLDVTPAAILAANTAYTVTTTGMTSVNGLATFDVVKNGTGNGNLVLGSLNDGGTVSTLVFQDTGTTTLGSTATSLINGTFVFVGSLGGATPGHLVLGAPGALGTLAFVNDQAGSSLALGANNTLGTLTGNGSVVLNGNTLTIGSSNNLSNGFSGVISDGSAPGGVTISGAGSFSLLGNNTYTGLTTINSAATLNVVGTLAATSAVTTSGTVNFAANNTSGGIYNRSVGVLTINNGGVATVGMASPYSTRTLLTLAGLSIAGAAGGWLGKMDLANNDMIVQGGSLTNITSQIAQGYANGTWQGSEGITSSAAAADPSHLTALGVIQNNQSGMAIYTASSPFDGATPGAGDILLKYTYYGDANLDGKVDGSDYSLIDNGFVMGLTGWFNGDFNYDGVVDGSDYTLIDNAFNSQGAQLTAAIATDQIAGASSAVPEPTTMSLLAIGAVGLLGRRRRRN